MSSGIIAYGFGGFIDAGPIVVYGFLGGGNPLIQLYFSVDICQSVNLAVER
jgi:hypothetical protein